MVRRNPLVVSSACLTVCLSSLLSLSFLLWSFSLCISLSLSLSLLSPLSPLSSLSSLSSFPLYILSLLSLSLRSPCLIPLLEYENHEEYPDGMPPIVLAGNKLDLEKNREVSAASAQVLADKWNAKLIETRYLLSLS